MSRLDQLAFSLILITAAASSGCFSTSADGFPIAGMVTYRGQPVPRGTLLLRPTSENSNSGIAVTFDIVDGRFGTELQPDRLHQGGAYNVRIYGYDGTGDPNSEIPLGQSLFSHYTTTIDLPEGEALGLEIEVKK
ncbi:hypothetical protein M4951_17415 [Blastopirellula sp. J2-11]|uniref:hypothetical protein n=1 Tax=Blastopirellula sp. J2-11 TaxID=2943192 RepID=UPI0021CA5AD6|nr:hypothetical protein [Blastopirellula sp. J2-11]UUO05154.1 hypothetical protein M4951_17415 [Blastopirellula sp. J2-11]